jgi:DNA-binding Lrp family transcriptional regulator
MKSEIDSALILSLQRGIPLDCEPYATVGRPFGLSSAEVLEKIATFREQGYIRRIGAVFNVSQLGYRSALCGITVPIEVIDSVVARLLPYPGITHCYLRDPGSPQASLPNLWFTLSTLGERFDETLLELQHQIQFPIRVAPATRKFKVQVVLDPAQLSVAQAIPKSEEPDSELPWMGTEFVCTNEQERRLIVLLHQDFPADPHPYSLIAAKTGYSEAELLKILENWKSLGALRRIAMLARHQKLGFNANAMCTWQVSADRIIEAGTRLASRKEITHCYERPPFEGFPYNLFAMIHADTEPHVRALAQDLSEYIGEPLGRLFLSVKEYKKTSLVPFSEG